MFIMTKIKRNMKMLAMLLVGSSVFYACTKDSSKPVTDDDSISCKDIRDENGVFTEIPNLSFESWYKGMGGGFEDPSPNCFWATANIGSIVDLGSLSKAPQTVFKVSDKDSVHHGNYAARLVTGTATIAGDNYVTAGAIAAGQFKARLGTPEEMVQSLVFGRKFNKKPKTVTGWYMYFPVESDSASAYCYVTKNLGGNKVDTLAFAKEVFYNKQDTYKQFTLNLEDIEETPDNIVIYFSSSEGGAKFEGQPGSTLYIDDLDITYYE